MNPILNMMMNTLQGKNPQMYQTVNQMMSSGGNPQEILKQMVGNSNPEQMQQILNQAKQMGAPDEVLKQIQNLK